MKNTKQILNQEIIHSSFYKNFKDILSVISENDKTSSSSKNEELVSYFIEAISFIKNMLEYNHIVFNDDKINYEEVFPQSNLYKNLSSEDFSSFTQFIFQELKSHLSNVEFYQIFETKAYNLSDIKDNEINFSNIKNSYLFPLKERLLKISQKYFNQKIKEKDFFSNYEILAVELKKHNILTVEDITNFPLYLEKIENLEEISQGFIKEPEHFTFFDTFNVKKSKHITNFGICTSSDIISLSLYLLSKNIGLDEHKIHLTQQVIKNLDYFSQNNFNSLINYIPLHHFNLVNSNVYNDLTVTEQLTKVHPGDLNIFQFNDSIQKTPKNKILCEALDNILKLDLNKFSTEEQISILQCSLEKYFGLSDESQQIIYKLSHSLSKFLNLNSLKNFSSFKENTFHSAIFIIKDALINDKNITPQNMMFKLISDTNTQIIITVSNFFNNPFINKFLDNESSNSFLKFYLYSYLQYQHPSFIIESNYKKLVYDDVLATRNKDGITFEEYLLDNKDHIFKKYENAMSSYFSIINNSNEILIFNTHADEFINKFKENSIVTIIPLLEYYLNKNKSNNIEDISKVISYKPFHNFTTLNPLEFSLHAVSSLNKFSENLNYEQLENLSLFVEDVFLNDTIMLSKADHNARQQLFETLINKPELKNFKPIIQMLKEIKSSNNSTSFLHNLNQECIDITLAKINHKILTMDNESYLSQPTIPTIRQRVKKF